MAVKVYDVLVQKFGILFLQSLNKLNLLAASKNPLKNGFQQTVPVDFVGITLVV